jgi:hypothetical protein
MWARRFLRAHTMRGSCLAVSLLAAVLLEAHYAPVKGTDPEYAQGAIEKTEAAHRQISRFLWLIQVPDPGDAQQWQEKLNAAVDPKHGAFRVTAATEEEKGKVEWGEIALQK